MMTHDEMIAVIQAHKDGKAVEWYDPYARKWEVCSQDNWPGFSFSTTEYRIKQQPREWVMEIDGDSHCYSIFRDSAPSCFTPQSGHKLVRVREVLE